MKEACYTKKTKIVLVVLITFLLVLNLAGCKTDALDPEEKETQASIKHFSEYSNKWCYQRLPESLQTSYGEIYTALKNNFDKEEKVIIKDEDTQEQETYIGIKISLSKPIQNTEEAKKLYNAFTIDNPEFFYISNLYSYEGYHDGGKDFYNKFSIVYNADVETRKRQKDELEKVIVELTSNLNRSNQFETELILHDSLLERVSYETETLDLENPIEQYPNAFTAYGALVEGKAVCEGYSRGMQMLLNRVGIQCTLVVGADGEDIPHMWNVVTVEGKNYHLDPTWNDSGDVIRHTLFNLSTSEIERTHTIDDSNIGVDTAVAEENQYFKKLGLYIDGFDSDTIANVISNEIKKGKEKIELQFSPLTFANGQLIIYEKEELIEKINEILKEENIEMWEYDTYLEDNSHFTILIEKREETEKE